MATIELPAEHVAEFEAERRHLIASANWVVNWIGFILYPITTFLDYLQHESLYGRLSVVRIGATGVLGLLLLVQWSLRKRGLEARLCRPMMWAMLSPVILHLDIVNVMVGGPETTYYAGVTLLLLAVLVAYPLSLKEMALAVGAISIQYNAVMLLFDSTLVPDGFLNANYFFSATAFIGLFATALGNRLRINEFMLRKRLEVEKARSDQLLLNILPEEVANELKTTGRVHARHIRSCSILFTDFVGFTRLANRTAPEELVRSLDRAFSRFDQIVDRWGLEKLKTVGDGYMAAGGVLEDQPDHLLRSILAGLEMMRAIEDEGLTAADGTPWRVRIGVHPGPVVAGVIGQKKFAFDLWGDTVNTASRLEAQGHPRTINLATKVYKAIEPFFDGIDRGYVPVRGKGPMAMTGITRLRPKYSDDPEGRVPNELFRQDARRWLDGLVEPVVGPAPDPTAVATRVELRPGPADPLSVLSELTPDDKQALMELAEPVSFRPGQVIVEQGQSLAVLLLIIRGNAAVRVAQEGVSVEVGQVRPGEVVGEMSFVSWEPASATVVALDEVVALRFEMEWMESLISRHPRTGVRLFHSLAGILAQRVRETNARMLSWRAEEDAAHHERFSRRGAGIGSAPPALESAIRGFKREMDAVDHAGVADAATRTRVDEGCARVVAAAAAADDGSGDGLVAASFLRETFPFFMRSAVIERMYARPLGAPWDYVAARSIYLGEPAGHGVVGPMIDSWFLSWKLAAALRSCQRDASRRIEDAYRSLRPTNGIFRVGMMSSGAAPELFDALDRLGRPDDVLITCMDRDLSALSALGQHAFRMGMADRFTFVCEERLDRRGRRGRLAAQNLVCLSCLADAIDDNALVLLLDEAHEALDVGGQFLMTVPDLPREAVFLADALLEWRVASYGSDRLKSLIRQSAFHDAVVEVLPLRDGSGSTLLLRRVT